MKLCIKFGRVVLDYEKATINNQQLKWMDTVKHLGNYIDTTNNDTIDCSYTLEILSCYGMHLV